MTRNKLLIAAVLVWPHPASAATLKLAAADRFFVTPHRPAVLEWTVESGTLSSPPESRMRPVIPGKSAASMAIPSLHGL